MRGQSVSEPAVDRRVRRSRTALFAAAVRLVSERQTTAISLTELAEAADLSRQAAYSHFADRDSLIVAAGMDLIERELFPQLVDCEGGAWRDMAVLATTHLARHREFYRALGTGPCAYPTKQAVLSALAAPGPGGLLLPSLEGGDVATFIVGGCIAMFTRWLDEGGDLLDPDDMADRLLGVAGQFMLGSAN
ncbi:TetR/AcrR family transcriptional regulator [Gordonia sesuvii]|uniref:TetR/AcrR family transcriptional regulator n=1 Tax=Gordonia sesuvii TaxID=3116777 RepID=UPI002ED1617B